MHHCINAKPEWNLSEEGKKMGRHFIQAIDLSVCNISWWLDTIWLKIPMKSMGFVIINGTIKWLFYKQGRFKPETWKYFCWEEGMWRNRVRMSESSS